MTPQTVACVRNLLGGSWGWSSTGHILLCFWTTGPASVGPGPGTTRKVVFLKKTLTHMSACIHYTHCGFTHMHGQYTAGDEFTVLSDAEVPRLYPHHVIKHELQVQASLYTHLQRVTALVSVHNKWTQKSLRTTEIQQCIFVFNQNTSWLVWKKVWDQRRVTRLTMIIFIYKVTDELIPSNFFHFLVLVFF